MRKDHHNPQHEDEGLKMLTRLVHLMEKLVPALDHLKAAVAALTVSTDNLTAAVTAAPQNEAAFEALAAAVDGNVVKIDAATQALKTLTAPPAA